MSKYSPHPLIMWGPKLQFVWFIHKSGQLMKIHWRQRTNCTWILRFQNRHIGGIVWLSQLNVTQLHTHTHSHVRQNWAMLPNPNKHVFSLFEILYGSHCNGVLQNNFLFSVNFIEASRCKFLLGEGGLVKGRIRPHTNGSSRHFTILKQH